jgi:hypothetical protein
MHSGTQAIAMNVAPDAEPPRLGGRKDQDRESHRLTSSGFDAKTRRRELPGTCETADAIVALARDNPDKALVMTYIGRLVIGGFAAWEMLENSEIEVRFNSGETYLLAETTILRIA